MTSFIPEYQPASFTIAEPQAGGDLFINTSLGQTGSRFIPNLQVSGASRGSNMPLPLFRESRLYPQGSWVTGTRLATFFESTMTITGTRLDHQSYSLSICNSPLESLPLSSRRSSVKYEANDLIASSASSIMPDTQIPSYQPPSGNGFAPVLTIFVASPPPYVIPLSTNLCPYPRTTGLALIQPEAGIEMNR
jgi:hypothetical protein